MEASRRDSPDRLHSEKARGKKRPAERKHGEDNVQRLQGGDSLVREVRSSLSFSVLELRERALMKASLQVSDSMASRNNLYEERWRNFLKSHQVMPDPEKVTESSMRSVLLAYVEFVHTGGYLGEKEKKKKESVKLGNVDLHLQFAAAHLVSSGYDDIRYTVRSNRSDKQATYFKELHLFRKYVREHEAATQSAVALDHTVFRRIHLEALKETDKMRKRELLLINVAFCFMARSQNIADTSKVKDRNNRPVERETKVKVKDVLLTNGDHTFLQNGKFSDRSLSGVEIASMNIPHQKNGEVDRMRSRCGVVFTESLIEVMKDLRADGASRENFICDVRIGGRFTSVRGEDLSNTLRNFAKKDGNISRYGRDFSSHSCRSSCAKLLYAMGYDAETIMLLGDWKSLKGVLPYIKDVSIATLKSIGQKALEAPGTSTVQVERVEKRGEERVQLSLTVEESDRELDWLSDLSEEDSDAEEEVKVGGVDYIIEDSAPLPESYYPTDEENSSIESFKSSASLESGNSTASFNREADPLPKFTGVEVAEKFEEPILGRGATRNRALKSYDERDEEEDSVVVNNSFDPTLVKFDYKPLTTKTDSEIRFENHAGEELVAIFTEDKELRVKWYTGRVEGGMEAADIREVANYCNADVTWSNAVRHGARLEASNYLSEADFQN